MKICVVQTNPVKGNIEHNIEAHVERIRQAASLGATVIIFPELSITAYEPTLAAELAIKPDDPRFNIFQQLSNELEVTIGVGAPIRKDDGLNIGMLIYRPRLPLQVYSKQFLHADELPYFIEGAPFTGSVDANDRIALAICYEISIPAHAESASKRGAQFYIASVVKTIRGVEAAITRLSEIASLYKMTALMSNSVGIAEGAICGGKSSVWNNQGQVLKQLDEKLEGFLIYDTETGRVSQHS